MKHISEKAYKGFNQRLIDAFKSIDPYYLDAIGVVMGMIDLYLGEKDVMFHVRPTVVKLAYMMILPELEKAVERSMRARANASRRREKKLAEREAARKALEEKIGASEQHILENQKNNSAKEDTCAKEESSAKENCPAKEESKAKNTDVQNEPAARQCDEIDDKTMPERGEIDSVKSTIRNDNTKKLSVVPTNNFLTLNLIP